MLVLLPYLTLYLLGLYTPDIVAYAKAHPGTPAAQPAASIILAAPSIPAKETK